MKKILKGYKALKRKAEQLTFEVKNYPLKEAEESLDFKQKQEMECDLRKILRDISRIEYYTNNLLGGRLSSVIRSLYFEGATIAQTAEKECISETMVKKCRCQGIEELAGIYRNIIKE
jgi:hypothetical protein